MIKAVIFDFFGVLATRGVNSFRKEILADDQQKYDQAAELTDALNRGNLGYDDFIEGLAKLASVPRANVLKYTENYQPNSELLDYIRRALRPGYKIGIISNAGEDWVLKILGNDNVKLFDDIILSYKTDFIKPEPEIYEMSAKNLGIKTTESIFIDDILRYCQGAEQVGMNSIWYQDFGGFKAEMDKLLSSVADD